MSPFHIVVRPLVICMTFNSPAPANDTSVGNRTTKPEPDASLAALWWPPQQNVWTPVGWKDHLFRFNVLYNGTVIAQPHVWKAKKHSAPWADVNLQLTITPSADGEITESPRSQPTSTTDPPSLRRQQH